MATRDHTTQVQELSSGVTTADRARVVLLGLNAWVVLVLVPTLHVGVSTPTHLALLFSPLPALALAVAALAPARMGLASVLLLAVVPPLLGLAIAARPALVLREIFDPITMILAALSLLAYAAAAAWACARPTRTMPVHSHPARARGASGADRGRLRRRLIRRSMIGITTALGLSMVLLLPTWMTRAARAARWGDAADDSLVFASVLATAVAAFAIGAIVGPGLRRRKRAISAKRRRRQLILAAAVAFAGLAGWLVLNHLER